VDVWWNEAIDRQAFGRIFRIGQEEKTSLTRLFATNTIDDKIHKMQKDKKAKIYEVLEHGRSSKGAVLDLLSLFGNVKEDEVNKGKYFVVGYDKAVDSTIFEDQAYLGVEGKKGRI